MSSFLAHFRRQRALRTRNGPQSTDPLKGPAVSERSDSDNSESASPRKTESPAQRLLAWWPELLSAFLSVGTLIAVAAVLYSIDGEPLENWDLPWQIKPNTVISTLITLVRLWMLLVIAECIGQLKWVYFEQKPHRLIDFETFDNASRGPWGAALLLARIRWRAIVASVGAILTILALAVDPFAQQVLSYVQHNSVSPSGQASLFTARSYDYNTHDSLNPSHRTKNNGLSAASLTALLPGNIALPNDVPFACASGNCTWPSFQALGFCSSCSDVSADTTMTCKYAQSRTEGSAQKEYSLACEFTTPEHEIQLQADYSAFARPNGTSTADVNYADITSNRPDGSGQRYTLFNSSVVSVLMTEAKHAEFLSYAALTHSEDENLQWRLWKNNSMAGWPSPTIYECQLSWCLKTYAASSAENGNLVETKPTTEQLYRPYAMFAGEATEGNSSFHKCMSVDEAMKWQLSMPLGSIDVDQDQSVQAAYTKKDLPKSKICPSPEQIRNSTTALGINIQDESLVSHSMLQILEHDLSNDYVGATALNQLFWSANARNVSATLENITIRMTNALRQGPNSTAVLGQVHYLSTHIKVNWPWLSYPAVLVFLTVVFLILTTIFSAEKSQVAWKSSSLAVLFHGLAELAEDDLRSPSMMTAAARKMAVQLQHDENGNLRLLKS
ncbi:hypothetical protein AC578_6840 [Pseudocercospora eumusae]|uniref:Uncharacterized protein n=1 Tax=Pseudocercospora eumusae TaxID=321146 RepID=A0A139H777_9PEZI|nr:hypothetical protein AC578_6840 [Pseudocercospora eumusae]